MHESRPTIEPESPADEVSSSTDVAKLVVHDERHREAYRLHRSGQAMSQIARTFGVSERTIYRWLDSYQERYRQSLESRPVLNLIAEEIAKLDNVEQEAMREAAATKFPGMKRGYLLVALKAMSARHSLLLEVGVLPREPTKVYGALQQLKPMTADSASRDERSDEEIRDDILTLLRNSRTLK